MTFKFNITQQVRILRQLDESGGTLSNGEPGVVRGRTVHENLQADGTVEEARTYRVKYVNAEGIDAAAYFEEAELEAV